MKKRRTRCFQKIFSSANGRTILPSKLIDGRCQVQSLVAIVDLAGLGSLWKIHTEGTPFMVWRHQSSQSGLCLQPNASSWKIFHKINQHFCMFSIGLVWWQNFFILAVPWKDIRCLGNIPERLDIFENILNLISMLLE